MPPTISATVASCPDSTLPLGDNKKMWLLTPYGFFSIVQKPADVAAGTLTVRARVVSDLETLRDTVLPTLSPTVADQGTDYAYRATAPREDVAQALGELVMRATYSNFKNEVAKRQ